MFFSVKMRTITDVFFIIHKLKYMLGKIKNIRWKQETKDKIYSEVGKR